MENRISSLSLRHFAAKSIRTNRNTVHRTVLIAPIGLSRPRRKSTQSRPHILPLSPRNSPSRRCPPPPPLRSTLSRHSLPSRSLPASTSTESLGDKETRLERDDDEERERRLKDLKHRLSHFSRKADHPLRVSTEATDLPSFRTTRLSSPPTSSPATEASTVDTTSSTFFRRC